MIVATIDVLPGYRVVKVAARTDAVTTPFEVAKDKIRDRVTMTRFEKEYDAYMQELRKNAQIELRVREVPLRLTGPITEGSLLEGLETGVGGTPVAPAAGGPTHASRPAAPAAPEITAPVGIGDDEISITPRAAPERTAPAVTPAVTPAVEKPKDDAPGQ